MYMIMIIVHSILPVLNPSLYVAPSFINKPKRIAMIKLNKPNLRKLLSSAAFPAYYVYPWHKRH